MGTAPDGMTDARLEVERTRVLPASPWLVWAVAGDTNRWNRVVGSSRTDYGVAPSGDGGHQQVGRGKLIGMPASWLERGEWLEGQFVLGERRYITGPLSVAGFRIDVRPEGDGTHVRLRADLTPSQPVPAGFAANLRANLERAADEYLDALDELFRGAELPEPDEDEPSTAYGRRAVMSLALGKAMGGRQTPVSESDFEFAVGKLADAPIEDVHRDRILELVETRPDYELEQVRPFELARAWGLRRRPLLRSFLHAANAGLFDLRWQLNCPRCRVGADSTTRIQEIGQRSHCDVCDIDFDIDFASNVEAVFRANPAIRAIKDRRFCTSSPWFRPHVFAVVELEPGAVRTLSSPETSAGFIARSMRGQNTLRVAPGSCTLLLEADGLHDRRTDDDDDDGTLIELRNDTDQPRTLLLERLEANAYATRGTDILTLPEFIDMYGTEAPASGADLSISSVTVLFTDLAQSTELYQRLGDARAFALVHAHFGELRGIIEEHNGATLKTMGDAVMASFASVGDATRAALRMVDATRSHRAHDLGLKVGIHQGPCVMVRANDRLDLFGTTVNIAWRHQEQAHRNQIVMSEALLGHRDVADAVGSRALGVSRIQAELKGLGKGHKLAVITVPAGTPD